MKRLIFSLLLWTTGAQAQVPKLASFDLPAVRKCAEHHFSHYDRRQLFLHSKELENVYICQIAAASYEEGRRVFSLGNYTMATDFSAVGVK